MLVLIILGVLVAFAVRKALTERRQPIGPDICPNCFAEADDCLCDGHRISGDW